MNRADVLRAAIPGPRRFLPGLSFGLLSSASVVALLACSAWLIVRAAEQPPILFFSMAVVGVRAFALARAVFRYLERLAGHDAAFRALADLRVGVYERLVPVAPDGLGRVRRGDLVSRIVADVDAQQDVPLRIVQPLLVSAVVATASVVGVWLLLPAMGAVLLVLLVLALAGGAVGAGLLSARADRELAPLRGELAERLNLVVTRLDVLIAFDAADEAVAHVTRAEEALARAARRRAASAGLAAAVLALCSGGAVWAGLALGVPAVGQLGGPALGVIALVPLAVFEVLATAPLAVQSARAALSSAQRLADLDREASSPALATDADVDPRAAQPTGHDIVLRDVTVSWPGAAGPALSGVSLELPAGARVLLTGASGSGKTTLAHALVRFLAYSGSYSLGGVEARTLPQDEVRRVIGLVEQQPYLFDDTIRQNLLFARPDAADAVLEDVLARVGLASWVAARGGLDARVGERGSLVSGGQAQRLALARALLADFDVLVLDEPTASVDAPVADALLCDLLRAAEGRTVVLIAHRVPPALVFDQRIRVERGTALTDGGSGAWNRG
ncbi:thiol reductant ABC exporter subunit CydC [Rathayibacter iranicus]|uniref:Thiol reductant ABC exporter subunit CydC n=2 Tax=Rathayibacter iranicus TaxID=59737 RepID=A0AAD1ELW5_9MICO|nr:thiol reductant ABC exporter subunit CydC [Rathayibacter iranicus]AZZ55486.1 thiol reductant ABC exporter subunit CydC [Rathayibacter iranicus]MWV31686.1 thiol reductant ABC exporter subunit CydC [Rathayibacter iranicus NCPPB 2253 = VKM Ac-1602]PPI48275.1 thiol reductant ABC exporter subunit CydC [Rathayibacter iranicus]PPI60906.1 thiol reductant ABC exporter subunit CydC [Rathayibacter iranicus]PPI72566.1 thiol reductant ABC exporter subunit CydC [Rathayibacter iranicus]